MKKLIVSLLVSAMLFLLVSPVMAIEDNKDVQYVKTPTGMIEKTIDDVNEEKINLDDPDEAALGKYKNMNPADLKKAIIKKGAEGINLVQILASILIIISFIISCVIVATGSFLGHGTAVHGWIGVIVSVIAFICVMNAPMIMALANQWAKI